MCSPNAEGAVDLEAEIQEWERGTIVDSLQQLWVQMMYVSEDAIAASYPTHLSHLTPLDEYTRSLGEHRANRHQALRIYSRSAFHIAIWPPRHNSKQL